MRTTRYVTALMCAFSLYAYLPLHAEKAKQNNECACTPKQMSKYYVEVGKKGIPAVVFIKVQGGGDLEENAPFNNPYDFGDDFFNRFFGTPQGRQKPVQLSQGSGFLVTADGYIMTNAHVVKGADKITVVLNDGKEIDATLIGLDTQTDLAVIKIAGNDYPFLKFGDSEALEVGECVVAIGSPFQLNASLTTGVVSAKGRQNLKITDLEDFIQTDAAINPGNSGGPLLTLDCEVIGINTAIVSRSGGYMGIGFAVPSSMAKPIMTQIIANGTVTRGFLGVSLQPVDKDIADAFNLPKPEGVLVTEVVKDSAADKGGLQQGDIILECNDAPIKTLGSFRNDISLMEPGSKLRLKVNRKGKMLSLVVTLGSASDNSAISGGVVQKLGIEVETLTADRCKQLGYNATDEGVVITKIKPGSSAALAGMRPGFLIVAVNHKKVANIEDFNAAIKESENKRRVLILAKDRNLTRFYSLKLD